MPSIVEVLLPRPLDHPFHYLVPDALQAQARPGVRAVVPFGHELLTGVIVETGAPPPSHRRGALKSIDHLLDQTPLLPPELLELLRISARYYAAPWGELLRSALPPPLLPAGARRFRYLGLPAQKPFRSKLAQELLDLLSHRPKGLSQERLLQRLRSLSPAPSPTRVMATLRRLAAAGLIAMEWHITPLNTENKPITHNNKPTLTHDNDNIETFKSHFINTQALLLENIKTQAFSVSLHYTPDAHHTLAAYFAVIAAMTQAGRSVLVLTPEIARAKWLSAQLQAHLQRPVIGFHSHLLPRSRARQWLALQTAAAPQVVVGSRSALFAPAPSLGLIIVDEEADPLFKQEERPRLHARDVAILRAQQARIPILLAGRFISVESYWHGQTGKYCAPPIGVTHSSPGVTTRLIDLRSEPLLEGLLTKPLIEAIDRQLASREQTLLFVNRRGYASGLICRDCGELIRCPTCRSALSFYSAAGGREAELRCRYCGLRMTAPTLCPGCRGHRLGPLGTGTQRVEEALRRQWPQAPLVRIDRDAPASPDAEAPLLIGTQLCLHRPPPPRLSLVAVLDAELDLSRPDFRAEERTMQLLIRLQGLLRAEPGSATLLIQSRQPERPPLQALATGSPALFYEAELRQRQELGYPPFSRLAVVRVGGQVEQLAKQAQRVMAAQSAPRVELWGPIPLPTHRAGRPRWEFLLKAPTPSALQRALGAFRALPLTAQLERQGLFQIEIDPV